MRSVVPNESSEQSSPEQLGANSFSSLMQPEQALPSPEQMMVSPLQLAQLATGGPQNPASLLAQMQMAQSSMVGLQQQLSDPNLKLNTSQRNQIKTKLLSANANIDGVYLKMGGTLEQQNDDTGGRPSKGTGPIAQFLGYLTDGLNKMEDVKHHVNKISKIGANLSPGDFLLVQLKLAKAQQELDFTGVLLSKTIDGFKQIMSVQL